MVGILTAELLRLSWLVVGGGGADAAPATGPDIADPVVVVAVLVAVVV
jgi:hypothetical protein